MLKKQCPQDSHCVWKNNTAVCVCNEGFELPADNHCSPVTAPQTSPEDNLTTESATEAPPTEAPPTEALIIMNGMNNVPN